MYLKRMTAKYLQTLLSTTARDLQTQDGSREIYANMEARSDGSDDRLSPREINFLEARDSFYMASVTEDGWPYVQHRGGPKGFLKAQSDRQIGFADFRGNRQFMSAGNLTANSRVSLILVDYPAQRRLKIAGHAQFLRLSEAPGIVAKLALPGTENEAQGVMVIDVTAFDWNCPKYITPRWTADEIEIIAGANS